MRKCFLLARLARPECMGKARNESLAWLRSAVAVHFKAPHISMENPPRGNIFAHGMYGFKIHGEYGHTHTSTKARGKVGPSRAIEFPAVAFCIPLFGECLIRWFKPEAVSRSSCPAGSQALDQYCGVVAQMVRDLLTKTSQRVPAVPMRALGATRFDHVLGPGRPDSSTARNASRSFPGCPGMYAPGARPCENRLNIPSGRNNMPGTSRVEPGRTLAVSAPAPVYEAWFHTPPGSCRRAGWVPLTGFGASADADESIRVLRPAAWLVAFPLSRLTRFVGSRGALRPGSTGTGLTAFAARSPAWTSSIYSF